MRNDTTIGINKQTLKRLNIVSAMIDKKLYELIEEATDMLEQKYNIIRADSGRNPPAVDPTIPTGVNLE